MAAFAALLAILLALASLGWSRAAAFPGRAQPGSGHRCAEPASRPQGSLAPRSPLCHRCSHLP